MLAESPPSLDGPEATENGDVRETEFRKVLVEDEDR